MLPIRRVFLEIAHALPVMRSRPVRDRGNRATSVFREAAAADSPVTACILLTPSVPPRSPRKLPTSANSELWGAHAPSRARFGAIAETPRAGAARQVYTFGKVRD